jgi:hypothetical protein
MRPAAEQSADTTGVQRGQQDRRNDLERIEGPARIDGQMRKHATSLP